MKRNILAFTTFVLCSIIASWSAVQAAPDSGRMKIGISLGSHAVIAKLGDRNFYSSGDLSLVEPGTPLLIRETERIYYNRQWLVLALSQLGLWLYVPAGPSNLIDQKMILNFLVDRIQFGREWRVVGQRVSLMQCADAELTPGESVVVVNKNEDTLNVELYRDNINTKDRFYQIAKNCPNIEKFLSADGAVLTFQMVDRGDQFLVDATSFIYEKFCKLYGSICREDSVKKAENANDIYMMVPKLLNSLYREWPKFVIDDVDRQSYGCDADSVEVNKSSEEENSKKISMALNAKTQLLGFEFGSESASVEKISSHLKQSFRPDVSMSERVAIYSRESTIEYVTLGKISKCAQAAPDIPYRVSVEPIWHRMHWQGQAPFIIDFPQFQAAKKAGFSWDQGKGTIEIQCFAKDYRQLEAILERNADQIQAKIFMAYYVQTPKGKWQAFWSCGK